MEKEKEKRMAKKLSMLLTLSVLLIFLTFLIYVEVSKNGITGNYLIGAESLYSGGTATGDSQFRILSPDVANLNLILIVELMIAMAVLGVLIIIAKSYRDELFKRKK